MTKDEIDAFVDSLKKQSKNKVRVKGTSKTTKAVSYSSSRSSFSPDVEVDHGNQTDIYEFEKSFAKTKLPEMISKWILFSIQAKKYSGVFYLVVDESTRLKFEKIVREKQLSVEVLSVK